MTATEQDRNLAKSFIEVVRSHRKEWGLNLDLPGSEIYAIEQVVRAAGWEGAVAKTGQLKGRYCDTGTEYAVNNQTPLMIVDEEVGDGMEQATIWLENLLSFTLRFIDEPNLEDKIADRIEQSRPLDPIRLNADGDYLKEYPTISDHARDDKPLGSCVGVHVYCNGWMDRHRSTKTHDVIVCRQCHLRIRFPRAVKTYGDLRRALND